MDALCMNYTFANCALTDHQKKVDGNAIDTSMSLCLNEMIKNYIKIAQTAKKGVYCIDVLPVRNFGAKSSKKNKSYLRLLN